MNSASTDNQPDIRFPHACEKLAAVIAHEGGPIQYLPKFREYVVEGEGELHPIDWCPFCGTLLPLSLRETHATWLREATSKSDSVMLTKLESDEWWHRVIRDGEVDVMDRPTYLSWGQPSPNRNKRRVFAVVRISRIEWIERLTEGTTDDYGQEDFYSRIIEQVRIFDDFETAEAEVKRLNEINVYPDTCVYVFAWAYLHADGGGTE